MAETELEIRVRLLESTMAVEQHRLTHHIQHDVELHDEIDTRINGMWTRRIKPLIEKVDALSKHNTYGAGFKAGLILSVGIVWAILTFGLGFVWNYFTGK